MARRLTPSVLAVTMLLALGSASAQTLRDPTRPPGSAESLPGEGESGLQSIVRRQGEKPQALINGELVALGGKVGESRLVAINADSVVLLDPTGRRETLQLTPGVSKTPSKPNLPATRKP